MWFSRNVLWHVDPFLLRVTGGRFSLGPGTPTLLLETTGARTGEPRAHAVIYFSDGDDLIVVASKFGAPEHPAWFHNACQNPDVLVNGLPYRAAVVEDEADLARLWPLADQVLPAYAVYRERASKVGRTIPVLRLHPKRVRDGAPVGRRPVMPDDEHIAKRADLLPEEKRAGSDDPEAQAEAILEESEERTEHPEETRHESVQTPDEPTHPRQD
jgi:deazaflavin-dependent oxidoreductase (nitroreductase family)